MSNPSYRSFSSPEDSRSAARRSDEPLGRERLIPFPARTPRPRDAERSNAPRRARRRRHSTPWLQRNALSIAALSFLFAMLGMGFGVVQMMNRAEPSGGPAAAMLSVNAPEQTPVMVAASVAPPVALAFSTALPAERTIQAVARVIDPNYTVVEGDTLGRIAARYNTTVERIAALNNITDARALRIGAKLVIPPPL